MDASGSESVSVRNAGAAPATPRKLFVNIPVFDLQRAIEFYEALGFTFHSQFTDSSAACMVIGKDAYFILMPRARFIALSERSVGDLFAETNALYAISAGSRDEVDTLCAAALAAGGHKGAEAQDHGFMYVSSFLDPEGHHWEVFWMDTLGLVE